MLMLLLLLLLLILLIPLIYLKSILRRRQLQMVKAPMRSSLKDNAISFVDGGDAL